MSLTRGTRIGPYEILGALGAGGMGEVYRARDARLNRDVAIKALPDAFALDPERIARFEREAKALASVSHPNIAGIHGLEEIGSARYLVLEVIDGESLAQRLARGPLPLDEALAIARQIADALAAAHEKGIVHRDLKPGNVMLTAEGQVKVLDFGLAKTADRTSAPNVLENSPTFTSPAMTAVGALLGTAAYMAPEQATGRTADKRCDVWAYGCVLYEMLTGTVAFSGEDVSATLAAVLRGEPDWTPVTAVAPPPIARLLRQCLQKDRTKRIPDISVARFEIDEWTAGRREDAVPIPQSGRRRRGRARSAALVAGGLAAGIAAAALSALALWPRAPLPVVVRFEVNPPADTRVMMLPAGAAMDTAVSADGTSIVFLAGTSSGTMLALRRLDEAESTVLPGTERAQSHSLSPDATRVAFHAGGQLHVLRLGRNKPDLVQDIVGPVLGTRWLDNDTIVFGNAARGVARIPAAGGAPHVIVEPEPDSAYGFPEVLPGGRGIVYTVERDGKRRIAARALPSGTPVSVAEEATYPRYVAGHLLFMQNSRLVGAPFDLSRLQLTAAPAPLGESVPEKVSGGAGFDVSPNGTFVTTSGTPMPYVSRLMIRAVDGSIDRFVGSELEYPRYPQASPDGRRIAATIGPGSRGQIWVFDVAGSAQPVKLTFSDHNIWPTWTRDGTSLLFARLVTSRPVPDESARQSIQAIPSDGSTLTPRLVVKLQPGSTALPSLSPDGRWMLYVSTAGGGHDIMLKSLAEEGQGRPWIAEAFAEHHPAFSPDGRWVAFVSNQTGAWEVWVRPFPGPGAPIRVSPNGGVEPRWAPNLKALYYQQDGKLMAAAITGTSPQIRFALPRMLFEGGFVPFSETTPRSYDVMPDGRFLMVEERAAQGLNTLTVVTGWDRVLAARLR